MIMEVAHNLKYPYELKPICLDCKKIVTLKVSYPDFKAWKNGTSIQDAFPYLTANEREILVSGICGECFDKLFEE